MGDYTVNAFPATGSANFATAARTVFGQYKTAIDGMDAEIVAARGGLASLLLKLATFAVSSHTHDGGSPVVFSLVAGIADLGTGNTDGEVKITYDEYGNSYTWDTGAAKWRIGEGNHYTTAGLPGSGYTRETGLRVFDVTTASWKRWDGAAWGSDLSTFTRLNKTQANSPYTVTAADVAGFTLITNTGASGELIASLPAGADGNKLSGEVTAAQYLTFDANGTETIRWKDKVSIAGGKVKSNVVGDKILLDWNGTQWSITISGTGWQLETS